MKYRKSVFRSLSLVTQLGLSVTTPISLCIFTGNYTDPRFGTKTVVPFLIVGTLVDSRCTHVPMKRMIAAEARDDEKTRAEILEGAREHLTPTAVKPKQPSRVRTSRDETDREDGDVWKYDTSCS